MVFLRTGKLLCHFLTVIWSFQEQQLLLNCFLWMNTAYQRDAQMNIAVNQVNHAS